MAILTTEQLNLSALRKAIQTALNLQPSQVVSDRGKLAEITDLSAFVVVDKIYTQEIGRSFCEFDAENEKENIKSALLTIIQISSFGTNSFQALSTLKAFLQGAQGDEILFAGKFAILTFGDVRTMAVDFGGGYEERAILELTLSHGQTVQVEQKELKNVDFIYYKES